MKKKIPVILSVDTGVDDAVAIILAVASKNIDIKLVVCSHGNTSIENVTNNTLGVLELINAPNIPVVVGSLPSPKRQKQIHNAHGSNGLGGVVLDKNNRQVISSSAEDKIYEIAKHEPDVCYINLGPSTTLANTIKKYPDLTSCISKIVFMGGSINEKLDTKKPYTEYNVASDPESAEIVLNSGIDILMVPTEIGRISFLDYYDIFKTKTLNKTGDILEKMFRNYRHRAVPNGIATCDSCSLFALLNPAIFEIKPCFGFVKYFKNVDTGVCLLDFEKTPNMHVVTNVDIKKFKKYYFKLLAKLP